jgi:hypothetical protein
MQLNASEISDLIKKLCHFVKTVIGKRHKGNYEITKHKLNNYLINLNSKKEYQ